MLQIDYKSKARWSMGAVDFVKNQGKSMIFLTKVALKGQGRTAPGDGVLPVDNFSGG
ncbi:hypothetical protein [Stenotrophomonas ginsengisoli]|uniref:hypothetical protein n=1 Tax=Stenotrophomonas ginsengisoli TaxID=336566 RepID=UPI001379D05B|nr:hypothetical protein [Stenotrophomonas ginsengisoli]